MKISKSEYKKELRKLQIELVKLQRHIIRYNQKILIIFEGRDASGKDGVIKRITEHLSPRETRVVAMGKPSDIESREWYFERYISHLPLQAEMVLFNRSWYNRSGVERIMGYCTEKQYETYIETVNDFESLLIRSGLNILKYYLDVSRDEQKRRLADRKRDPLKQWKTSPVDKVAIKHWDDYTAARNEMLERTNTKLSPWIVVKADNKKITRLNVIKDILSRVECPERDEHFCKPDSDIICKYKPELLKNGFLVS